jgi:P2 family phage contractile tail tube protein
MALPKKLKYFNMFFDGDNYFGMVPEITPPNSPKNRRLPGGRYAGFGCGGSGLDAGALDMDITLGGMDAGLMKKWGVTTADGMQVRFAGSYQDDATGDAVPCEIQTRGRFTELDPGSAKVGDDTSHKYTLKNTYYKLTINSEEIIEIDVLNMIYKVAGVDVLEKHRANIGL